MERMKVEDHKHHEGRTCPLRGSVPLHHHPVRVVRVTTYRSDNQSSDIRCLYLGSYRTQYGLLGRVQLDRAILCDSDGIRVAAYVRMA